MSETIKQHGTWIFRGVMLVVNLAVFGGMLWIKAEIRKELGGYVTKEELRAYQTAHEKWGDEVVKQLRDSVNRIEAKVDRLIEKRP